MENYSKLRKSYTFTLICEFSSFKPFLRRDEDQQQRKDNMLCHIASHNYNNIRESFDLNWKTVYTAQKNHILIELEHLYIGNTQKTSQHGFAVMVYDDRIDIVQLVKPKFKKKGPNIHTEEILIDSINERLDNNLQGNRSSAHMILIYTYNSPCLKRENKKLVSCFSQLQATKWSQKGISTHVFYSTRWGPLTSSNFEFLTYSTISDPANLFHKYLLKYNNVPFRLDQECFEENRKAIKVGNLLPEIETKHRSAVFNVVNKIKQDLSCVELTIPGYLDHLKEVVDPLKCVSNKISDTFLKIISNTIETTVLRLVREDVTSDLNNIIVDCFLEDLPSILGNNSHLRLHHVHQDNVPEEIADFIDKQKKLK